MGQIDIFAVGFELPEDSFENISFNSGMSLLDADIVLFEPNLSYQTDSINSTYQGKPSLSASSSVDTRRSINHWRDELKQAFDAGKTIFIFLRKPEEVYANTGTQELSGTGRNQKVIHHVGLVDSYGCLPLTLKSLTAATGQKVKFCEKGQLLAAYWKAMKDLSYYEVHYEHDGSTPLMVTKSGDRIVASLIQGQSGALVLLPPLDFTDDEFRDYSSPYFPKWTTKAKKRGKALASCLVEIHKTLRHSASRTPAPDWSKSEVYQLTQEKKLLSHIANLDKTMRQLSEERREYEQKVDEEAVPRGLLYETGKALEIAVIDALRTFGFSADRYVDDESEFDMVFESSEGRFLGEAEGKDNTPISIVKLQQLERNIQEDFAKERTDDYAKGVLFGNPYRLTEPGKRKEPFTTKAISAAKRTGIALVHTPDMFPLVQYLKSKKNASFAKKVREAIASVSGEIVTFPSPR
jgi:hypothetical protein